jgi:hypothetical protein
MRFSLRRRRNLSVAKMIITNHAPEEQPSIMMLIDSISQR